MMSLEFDYFYGAEAEQFTFYRIPKLLFTDKRFSKVSIEAKVLYGLMLDRMSLSLKNGWVDEENRVYIYFKLEDAMEFMGIGKDKGVKLFAELDYEKGCELGPGEIVELTADSMTQLAAPGTEMRMCALLILVNNSKKIVTKETFDFYLSHTKHINNWDLVDLSAPQIVGKYLLNKDRDILYELAESDLLWDNRIAIVSTLTFIRSNDLDDTFKLSLKMMQHKHDLMHKSIGWMLREAGKRDATRLYNFVKEHKNIMPRTMLRYSIEKFDDKTRKELMS